MGLLCSNLAEYDHDSIIIPFKVVKAVEDIKPGSQIFNCYTNGPDDELFLDYGFCLGTGLFFYCSRFYINV